MHAGGAVNEGSGSQLQGPAGSGNSGRVAGDTTMAALVPATPAARFSTGDLFFRALFGMEAPTYRQQPAVVRFDCSGGGCSMADLESALVRYAGLTLWFDGDLLLDNPPGAALGDAANPAMLIVTGQLRLSVAASITGFVYASDVAWTGGAANASVRGAVVALNDFVADVPAILVYDVDVLKTIQLFFGSFVRVPGGWNRPT